MTARTPEQVATGIFPTLRDPEAQTAFKQDGIVVVPLLSADEARRIRQLVIQALPEDPGAFFDLFRNNPPGLRRELDRLIRTELEDQANEVFIDHEFWSATVLVKPPGPDGEVGLHTDWNMVDETRYRSGLIWIALGDSTNENGGLHAVPGSNLIDLPNRGHNTHLDFEASEVRRAIDARTVPVDVAIGEAAVWDNRVLHGSKANRTNEWRIAAALGFKPREAQLFHYRKDADGELHRYQINREFFLDYLPFDPETVAEGPHVLAAEPQEEREWTMRASDLGAIGPGRPVLNTSRGLGPEPAQRAESAVESRALEETRPRGVHRLWKRAGRPTRDDEQLALRWLDLEPDEVARHPTALEDISERRLDGITIGSVFTPEECALAVVGLENEAVGLRPAIFGTMLGMSLANLGAYVDDPRQRDLYYDDADYVRSRYMHAFGGDPLQRVADILAPASGGRRFATAEEDGRHYLGGNIRWMVPRGLAVPALPAHVGNEFVQQHDGSTDHLRSVTRIQDHYSWFVVLQVPESGGELSVFDLVHESSTPANAGWGQHGRNDAAFDDLAALIIAPEVGQLILFGGGWRWHRVNRIKGNVPRVTLGGFAGPSLDGKMIHSWF